MVKRKVELSPFFKDFYRYFDVVTIFSWVNEEYYTVRPKPIIRNNPSGWHHVLLDMGYYGTDDGVYYEEALFLEHLNEEFLIIHWLDFENSSFAQEVVAACKKYIPFTE